MYFEAYPGTGAGRVAGWKHIQAPVQVGAPCVEVPDGGGDDPLVVVKTTRW
jgi:hypothetical protein